MRKFIVNALIIAALTLVGCSSNPTAIPFSEFKEFHCKGNYELTNSDSKRDGEWEIFTCSPIQLNFQENQPTTTNIDNRDSYTVVRNINLSKGWTISYNDFTWADEQTQHLVASRWSQDGNYLFLSPDKTVTGIFYSFKGFIDGHILYRFNLITGDLETILPFNEIGYAFSPSQYNQNLAYVAPSETRTIRILDLATWDEKQTEVDSNCAKIGGFAWKPDGISLVFTCGISDLTSNSSGTSFFILNTNNMKIQSIVENDKRLLFPHPSLSSERNFDYWLDADLLSLWSPKNQGHYYLNINTGMILRQ